MGNRIQHEEFLQHEGSSLKKIDQININKIVTSFQRTKKINKLTKKIEWGENDIFVDSMVIDEKSHAVTANFLHLSQKTLGNLDNFHHFAKRDNFVKSEIF